MNDEIPGQVIQKDFFFVRFTPETASIMKSVATLLDLEGMGYKVEFRKRFDTLDGEMYVSRKDGRQIPPSP